MVTANTIRPMLHHVNLKTRRLQETVVGTQPTFQFPNGAFLTNDGANHRLALISSSKMSDDPDKISHTGMHHLAFEYKSCDDLLATFMRLKALNIVPHMALDHGMTMSFYYVDPDGNSVELQSDNFGDWKSSTEWMQTSEQFAKNPIGMFVDPSKMVVARADGASLEELHRRAYAGEFLPNEPADIRIPL